MMKLLAHTPNYSTGISVQEIGETKTKKEKKPVVVWRRVM